MRQMKARIERERLPAQEDPLFHTKLGRGGLADVEWAVQLLQTAPRARRPPPCGLPGPWPPSTPWRRPGTSSPARAEALRAAYRLLRPGAQPPLPAGGAAA